MSNNPAKTPDKIAKTNNGYVIPASEWVKFPEDVRWGLKHFGGLPTNDVFLPLWVHEPKIWILRGGRGGGKSEAVADRLIEDCRNEKYFKCYYGRKVFETVRGSCFATLIECIKKRNLQHEFNYSEANSSSMHITHIATGNTFIPFGSDKAEKLKSIKDPTHIWCEEFPEFTFEDFKELYPTLRTTRGKNQLFITFNAYSIHTDSWIIKLFDPEYWTGDKHEGDQDAKDILGDIEYRMIVANYYDNYFIDQEAYKQTLWLACGGNQLMFNGVANGDYGYIANDNPWLYSWDGMKNVKDDLPNIPDMPVYISFDFNNNPFAATAWQFHQRMGDPTISFIHCIREFSGKIKVEDMCAQIRAAFPSQILYVTGDRSGQNEDLGRNQTLYEMIASLLQINKKALILNNTNLEHIDSQLFCNIMLNNYPNFFVSRKGCPQLIKQCGIATVDLKSMKAGQLLKDRATYKMDEFDSFRYFLQTFFHSYAKNKYLRLRPPLKKS